MSMSEIGPNSVISFGKYKGKTAEYVARSNPSYVLWMDSSLTRFTVAPDLRRLAVCVGMMMSEDSAEQYGSAADYGFPSF